MILPKTTVDPLAIKSPGTILLCYRGSVSHSTYVPPTDPNSIDDVDFIGLVIAPVAHYLGLTAWGSSGTREIFDGNVDLVEYEIRKFTNLLLVCNPNILSVLWAKPDQIIYQTSAGEKLRTIRELFLSKKAHASFVGYANGQLKKMGSLAFQGYMGEKRRELVRQFGYDTKNASHCIRIFRMGIELLETGAVNVDRANIDAEELLSIKRGAWSYDRVASEARSLEIRANEALLKTSLPDEPDRASIEKALIEILKEELTQKREE